MAGAPCANCGHALTSLGHRDYCGHCGWNRDVVERQLRRGLKVLWLAWGAAVVAGTMLAALSPAWQGLRIGVLIGLVMATVPFVWFAAREYLRLRILRSLRFLQAARKK